MISDPDGIAYQHRRLDEFLDEVEQALDCGDRRACETAAFRLQGALNAHFDVEREVTFPSIRARRPTLGSELDALEAGHASLSFLTETLCTWAFASDAPTVHRALTDLRAALEHHERKEEGLCGRAEADAAPAGAPDPPSPGELTATP